MGKEGINKSTPNAMLVLDCNFNTDTQVCKTFQVKSKTLKGKKTFELEKPVVSACIEGMIEYSRIVFDLFPLHQIKSIRQTTEQQPKINIVFPQSKLKLNTLHNTTSMNTMEGVELTTPQCSREILKDIALECKEASYIPSSFRLSLKNIAKFIQYNSDANSSSPSSLPSTPKPYRIIIILQPSSHSPPPSSDHHSADDPSPYRYFPVDWQSGEVKEEFSIPEMIYNEILKQRSKLLLQSSSSSSSSSSPSSKPSLIPSISSIPSITPMQTIPAIGGGGGGVGVGVGGVPPIPSVNPNAGSGSGGGGGGNSNAGVGSGGEEDIHQQIKDLLSCCELIIIRLQRSKRDGDQMISSSSSSPSSSAITIHERGEGGEGDGEKEKGKGKGNYIKKRIVKNIATEVHWVEIDQFVEVMQDLASIHYHLKSLRITGIPMKKEHARANYDVVLLYPSDNHLLSGSDDDHLPLGSHRCLEKMNELKLQWKTTEKGFDHSSLDCTCVHRLTPLSISSSPSQCLTRFLLSKRPVVTLLPVNHQSSNESAKQYISHLVLQQGGQMYLHCLTPSFHYDDDLLKSLFSFYNNNEVVDLRINAFIEIIEKNKLFPSPPSFEKLPLALCPPLLSPDHSSSRSSHSISSLDPNSSDNSLDDLSLPSAQSYHTIKVHTTWDIMRKTMFFPYTSSNSILYSTTLSNDLLRLLNPLRSYLEQPELLNKNTIDFGIDILKRLYQASQINDSSLFPSTNKRKESYQLLWKEILTLAQRSSLIHPGEPTPFLDRIKQWYDPPPSDPSSSPSSISSPLSTPISSSNAILIGGPSSSTSSQSSSSSSSSAPLDTTWKELDKNKRQFELGTYVNSDLTHQGSSLDEEKKRKPEKKNDPLEHADNSSLFFKYWSKEINKIPKSKFVL